MMRKYIVFVLFVGITSLQLGAISEDRAVEILTDAIDKVSTLSGAIQEALNAVTDAVAKDKATILAKTEEDFIEAAGIDQVNSLF